MSGNAVGKAAGLAYVGKQTAFKNLPESLCAEYVFEVVGALAVKERVGYGLRIVGHGVGIVE